MDDHEARIRREMEHTRAAMGAKVAIIQARIKETVEEAESTVVGTLNSVLGHVKQVQDMIENVTSTVDTTMECVQNAAYKTIPDGKPGSTLPADMAQNPWIMIGAAVVVGYILGAGGQPSSAVSPSTAGSPSDAKLGDRTADNAAGHPFTSPSSTSVECTSIPSPASSSNLTGPQ